jgi:hypothetical protein
MYTEKELLQLAGKLALICHQVINSNAKTISDNIKLMEQTLFEYDNAIFINLKEAQQNGK